MGRGLKAHEQAHWEPQQWAWRPTLASSGLPGRVRGDFRATGPQGPLQRCGAPAPPPAPALEMVAAPSVNRQGVALIADRNRGNPASVRPYLHLTPLACYRPSAHLGHAARLCTSGGSGTQAPPPGSALRWAPHAGAALSEAVETQGTGPHHRQPWAPRGLGSVSSCAPFAGKRGAGGTEPKLCVPAPRRFSPWAWSGSWDVAGRLRAPLGGWKRLACPLPLLSKSEPTRSFIFLFIF